MNTICWKCGFKFDDEGKDIKTVMQTYSNGIDHKKALCPSCGEKQNRALPQTEFVEVIMFGKHKGRKLSDLAKEVPDYLNWLLENATISSRIRRSIEHYLSLERDHAHLK